jgi:hypothetical protein
MKIRKLWLNGLLVLVLFGFFMVNLAQAQLPDLKEWEGKWFKLTVKTTGLFFDGSKLKTGNDNSTNYLYINGFNSTLGRLTVQVWEQNDQGGWGVFVDDLSLKIIAGTDLDFLFVTMFESNDPLEPMFFGFAARITGRKTQGVLKSATLKSLGGFSWEQLLDLNPEYFAAGVSINGSLIDPSKLPFTPTP